MPTYTSINFIISKSNLADNLVRDFYEAIQIHNVYARACSEEFSLDDIISWNQQKLDSNFRLGPTQHFSEDYRQILLFGTPYDECRLYIYVNYQNTIGFHLIVPESDVKEHGCEVLKSISKSVVKSIPIDHISSSDETAHTTATIEMIKGQELAVQYFGYVKDEIALENEYFKFTALGGGYFIEYKSA